MINLSCVSNQFLKFIKTKNLIMKHLKLQSLKSKKYPGCILRVHR